MCKKDYYGQNKNIISKKIKQYYKNDILNILKELVQEISKDRYKYLTEDYQKQYRDNNSLAEDKKQKMKEYQKEYRKNNPLTEDKKQKMKEYQKEYRKNNPLTERKKQKMKEYQKK